MGGRVSEAYPLIWSMMCGYITSFYQVLETAMIIVGLIFALYQAVQCDDFRAGGFSVFTVQFSEQAKAHDIHSKHPLSLPL